MKGISTSVIAAGLLALTATAAATAQSKGTGTEWYDDIDYQEGRKFSDCCMYDSAAIYFERAAGRHAKKAEIHNWLGWSLWQSSEYERAITSLDKAISLAKKDPEIKASALLSRGYCLKNLKRYKEAQECAVQIIASGIGIEKAIELEADIHVAQGLPGEAMNDYERMIKNNPNSTLGHGRKIQGLAEMGRDAEALEAANTAAKATQDDEWILAKRALCNYKLDNKADAVADILTSWDKGGSNLAPIMAVINNKCGARMKFMLKSKINRAPGRAPQWHNLQATLHIMNGEHAEAYASLRNALKESSTYTSLNGLMRSTSKLLAQHKYCQAEALLRQIATLDSSYARDMGIHIKSNKGEDVAAETERLLAREKGSRYRYSNQAMRSRDPETVRRALEALGAAIKCGDGDMGTMLIHQAIIYEELGEHDKAVEAARKGCTRVYGNRGYMGVDELADYMDLNYHELLGNAVIGTESKAAEDCFARAMKAKGDRNLNLYAAAALRARQGRTDEAAALLDSAWAAGYWNISWMERDPLMDSMRDNARYKALLARNAAAWECDFADTAAVETSMPCEIVYEKAKLEGSANGLKMDVYFNPKALWVSISKIEVEFMTKNGKLTYSDYVDRDNVIIKELNMGNLTLTDIQATITEQDEPVVVPPYALLREGFPSVDKKGKRLVIRTLPF